MKVGRSPGAVVVMVWQLLVARGTDPMRIGVSFFFFLFFLFGHTFKNLSPFLHVYVGTVNSDFVLFGYVTLSAAAL